MIYGDFKRLDYTSQQFIFRPLCIDGKTYHFDFRCDERYDEYDHLNYLDNYFDDVNSENMY